MLRKIIIFFVFIIIKCSSASGQDTLLHTSDWGFHFQQTVIGQYHFDFNSPYSGFNSLAGSEKAAYSVTSTVFLGRKLWHGGEIYFNPELAGGSGLSGSVGVAGALNGETYRIGDPAPSLAIARLYVQENIALSDEEVMLQDIPNQIGEMQPAKRITFTIGKYSLADQFDVNSVSHDPRSQFFNWALMSAGAWDYPADTKGYTIGATVEYITPQLTIRAATDMVAKVANQLVFDQNFSKAHSETFEVEIPHHLLTYDGTVRILAFHTLAHMGNYLEALAQKVDTPDISLTRVYGRSKYGFELNIDQHLSKDISGFFRASWNDGKNETWMFTEIDQSICLGIAQSGAFRNNEDDILRAGVVIDGVSNDHRKYLEAGGSGFILGDGKLNYALEEILEVQYATHLTSYFTLSADYQFVMNPGYNHDRGPVHVIGLRAHVEL